MGLQPFDEILLQLARDLDPKRVRDARTAGRPVYYGDATERATLEAVGITDARLLLVSFDQVDAALKLLHHTSMLRPDLPVMVRTRDESHVDERLAAGATEVVPETLEAYVFTFLPGARASCPRRRDEGGTPSLPGACMTPGENTYLAAALMIAAHVLLLVDVPLQRVVRDIGSLRAGR